MRVQYFIICLVAGFISICTISVQLLDFNPLRVSSGIQQWNQQKKYILSDQESLIAKDFEIPENLQKRVQFWFDIYSRYNGYHKIIHHNLYPWVIYEVVDIRGISRPENYMKEKIKAYKKIFRELYSKKENFTEEELKLISLFNNTPNKRRALRTAAIKIRYQTGQRDSFEEGLVRSHAYLPHMEKIFKKKNLPTELTRLPFVESSFNWHVYSRVGAAGMWQFMKRTGRKFMRINRGIDERMSPLKSTVAAALLLKQNHRILYKSWPLALTAYNHGPTGLRRAVRRTGSRELASIITHYRHERFSFASANFYSGFLAALYAEKYRSYIFPHVEIKGAPPLQEQIIDKKIKARDLLKALNCSPEDFLNLNPDLKKAVKKNYFIPSGLKYFVPVSGENLRVADASL